MFVNVAKSLRASLDKNHYLMKEIAYHGEIKLTGKYSLKVLHVHDYDNNHKRKSARLITQEEIRLYNKYFIGVPGNDKW